MAAFAVARGTGSTHWKIKEIPFLMNCSGILNFGIRMATSTADTSLVNSRYHQEAVHLWLDAQTEILSAFFVVKKTPKVAFFVCVLRSYL